MEIERKYLLTTLPPAKVLGQGVSLKQGYISTGDPEVRVRAKGMKFYLTIKSGEGLVRQEFEVEIQANLFTQLCKVTEGACIEKTRYFIEHQGLTWEIDEYYGKLTGLYTAEVELRTETQYFEIPEFLQIVSEVTEDERYKNKNLSTYGMPR